MRVNSDAGRVAERVALPGVERIAKAIQAEARQNVYRSAVNPDRRLGPGIHVKVDRLRRVVRVVSEHPTANVPKFQHEGTGIYGPKRRPIRPKRAPFLAWRDQKTGDWVFAKEVRGSPPRKYLFNAAATVARKTRGVTFKVRP